MFGLGLAEGGGRYGGGGGEMRVHVRAFARVRARGPGQSEDGPERASDARLKAQEGHLFQLKEYIYFTDLHI